MEIKLPTENSSKHNVVEYLITKLESRAKYMRKVRRATISVKASHDFFENKQHMMKIFSEIEDDLTQGACALKVINLQNKGLTEQLQISSKQKHFKESKVVEETIKELSARNENLINELNGLRLKLEEKDNIINELSEAVNKLEGQIINKFEIRSEDSEIMERLIEENEFLKKEVLSVITNKKERANEGLKDILEFKENNKTLLNEKIKSFFKKTNDMPVKETNEGLHPADIVISKLSKSEDLLTHITKTFGEDFMNKLFNGQLDQDYLKAIEEVIHNFEAPEIDNKMRKSALTNNTIKEVNEESYSPEHKYRESLGSLNKSLAKIDIPFKRSNSSCLFGATSAGVKPFEKLLRSYNKCLGLGRKFIPTSIKSEYFDKGLATGGISKLEYSENIRKRNKKSIKSYGGQ
jgi:hypothetical protein